MKNFYFLAALALTCAAAQAQTSFGNVEYPAPNSAGTGGGSGNSYFGHNAGDNNTATQNTFLGAYSGFDNTTGDFNTFIGSNSGFNNVTGSNNIFIGYQSGYNNTAGGNILIGYQSGYANTSGTNNTALGTQALRFNTTAGRNTAIGSSALYTQAYSNGGFAWNTDNVALGFEALYTNNPTSNTNGYQNTALGTQALRFNTTGSNNLASGYQALYDNTLGSNNVAQGNLALNNNTTAGRNTAIGSSALYTQAFNNGGATWNSDNIALGFEALYTNNPTSNTNGYQNTALGTQALRNNSTGYQNTATGYQALYSNSTGYRNTASGYQALYSNSTGDSNTAVGTTAMQSNTSASNNIAVGAAALFSQSYSNGGISWYSNNVAVGPYALFLNNPTTNDNGYRNTAVGAYALDGNTTGTYNIALGYNAGVSVGNQTNSTVLGSAAVVNASNKVRLGNASVTVIEGQVAYTFPSDGRFKTHIEEKEVKGLDFINRLRPVVYNFDTRKFTEFLTQHMPDSIRSRYLEDDFGPSTAIRQSGFIAQEVEKAAEAAGYTFNGLHKPDTENDNYSLAYSLFVVPLVKGMQELSARGETQKQLIETQQQQLDEQKRQNEMLLQELETLKSVVYGSPAKTNTGGKTSAESEPQTLPGGFALYQNIPNPFDRTTVIGAQLPESVQQAKIVVYNLQGLELVSYPLSERGKVSVEISGGRFPAGMYLYALLADGQVIDTKKMILTE